MEQLPNKPLQPTPSLSKWNLMNLLPFNQKPLLKNWRQIAWVKSTKPPRKVRRNHPRLNLHGPWPKSRLRRLRSRKLMIYWSSHMISIMTSIWRILRSDRHSRLSGKELPRLSKTMTGRKILPRSGIRPLRRKLSNKLHLSKGVCIHTVSQSYLIF